MPVDLGTGTELGQDELKQTVFRLAHFDPNCRDGFGNQVIDYLVLDALTTFGQIVVTALELKQHIKKTFHLDFEEAEINASGKRLGQKGTIVYELGQRFEKPTFQILPAVQQKIAHNLVEIQELESAVLDSWRNYLYAKYKDYPVVQENVQLIIENLQLFLSRIFVNHGVESVALLYPEESKVQKFLDDLEGSLFETLPRIDPLSDAVTKVEILAFLRGNDPKRKTYISSLFNSSFFWHLVQVDEKCSRLLSQVTKGQKLYLDSNILYSLAGLHGANMLQSMHSMLKLAKALNYELWVTSKSVDEFHESLNWQLKELKGRLPVPAELAKIALENLEKDSFITVYWGEFVANGTSIEEFVAERSHIENILHGLDIKTTNDYRKNIEGSQELANEEAILRSIITLEVNEHIVEHDAFHRVFINKIRQNPRRRFSEAGGWFLTHDTKLPAYDRAARKGKNYLPFCITTDQWVQINRPLLTRTANQDEYEESFHLLVTQPYLRTLVSTLSLEEAHQEVLGKLARYKNMNPQLALEVVADTHFMVSVAQEDDDTLKDKQIENKFVDMAAQLETQKRALEKDVVGKDEELENRKGEIEILAEKLGDLEHVLEETKTLGQQQVDKLQKSLDEEKTKSEQAMLEATRSHREFGEYKASVIKWIIFTCVLGLSSLLLWTHQYWLRFEWLNTHKNRTLIEIATEILLVFALLTIPLKRNWQLWLTLAVAMAGVIFALAVT